MFPALPPVLFRDARFVLWGWREETPPYTQGCAFLCDTSPEISRTETSRIHEDTRSKWERLRRERGLIRAERVGQ